jgi:hypothetical protein
MKKLPAGVFIIAIIFFATMQSACRHDKPIVINIPCDTAHITFSGSVMPILNNNCRLSGCHVGNNPPNNVSFDNYSAVKAQLYLVNGTPELLGVITHAVGFTPMPKNSTMLDTCSIYKIKRWIADGAPNN